jgi:TorA-specific chaperone
VLDALKQLCRLFWGPDVDQCREIFQGKYFSPLEALKAQLDDKSVDGLQKIDTVVGSFTDKDTLCNYLEENFVRLFISHKEGIVAPLYQSCYEFENAPLMGASATMMTDRFESKGLSITQNLREPPDHLSVEMEYLYYLLEKGWSDGDDILVEEAVSFASENMLPWIRQFAMRLNEERGPSFYFFAAFVLSGLLQFIAESEL